MFDDEIVKALKCCSDENCDECPFHFLKREDCVHFLSQIAYERILSLETEIQTLQLPIWKERRKTLNKSCENCIYNGQPATCAVCIFCGTERKNYMPKTDKYTTMTVEEFEYNEGFGSKEEVNHPTRYNSSKYECIDVMADVFGEEETAAFCKLNAFKYIWREKHKGGVEDIDKAIWYLDKYKELIE